MHCNPLVVTWRAALVMALLTSCELAAAPAGMAAASELATVLRQPQSQCFWIEQRDGQMRVGDPRSRFANNPDCRELTFDTGNNQVLANVGMHGEIKTLTIYRDSYRATCNPDAGWPGVWLAKDNSSFGPYSYTLEAGGATNDLAKVNWDFHTGLLDNIFPLTELTDPHHRFTVRLITYAPMSADGEQRLRGVVYGLLLENQSSNSLTGAVVLPRLFANGRDKGSLSWAQFDPYDYEIGLADAPAFQKRVAFDLPPGGLLWVPTILYMPGDPTIAEVNQRGSLAWLEATHQYFRKILGRLTTPADPFIGEFCERQVMQAFLAMAMSGTDKLAGSNWGSYPATRQIWAKDCFYSCLPFMARDPVLARKMILWFDEFGVRQTGEVVAGGLNHSISLSVASILLAAHYYDQTGDADFFQQHLELKAKWAALLDALLASRQDPNVWLFPTRYISDGRLDCDWHCGSNVAVWRALDGFARILREVYQEPVTAEHFAAAAGRVQAAIMAKTVIPGPFGPQFIEGVNRDGTVPRLTSDGEESDTTLMPFYGFLPYDNATYLHYMNFSMSTNNVQYVAATRSINWGDGVPATAPGYNKGLCAALDREALLGDQGYFTEIRRVTDMDGSVPWWPYKSNQGLAVRRSYPGKAGWFAGVFSSVFESRFLGVSYDAPGHVFHFAPLAITGAFDWRDLPMGREHFSVRFTPAAEGAKATFTNSTAHSVSLVVWLPARTAAAQLEANSQPAAAATPVSYLGQMGVRATLPVGSGESVNLRVLE